MPIDVIELYDWSQSTYVEIGNNDWGMYCTGKGIRYINNWKIIEVSKVWEKAAMYNRALTDRPSCNLYSSLLLWLLLGNFWCAGLNLTTPLGGLCSSMWRGFIFIQCTKAVVLKEKAKSFQLPSAHLWSYLTENLNFWKKKLFLELPLRIYSQLRRASRASAARSGSKGRL